MRRKVHLRKKRIIFNKRKSNILIFSLLSLFISVILVLQFISSRITPGLMEYAEIQAKKFVTLLINSAVTESIGEDLDADSLFLITKDSNGEIRSIDLDPVKVNRLLSNTTNSVQVNLQHIERGEIDKLTLMDDTLRDYNPNDLKKGVIGNIPTGVIFKNALLSNLGPKFPIRLKIMGDIITNIKTKVTNYGINNAVIEVSIQVDVTTQAILPFSSKVIKVSSDIPLTIKLMQGDVPSYYFGDKVLS
ncbi:MAG: sporulation protein YunB [Bacilli bacterium]|nr:sporulation protein YunB [Bacilli bacterium]